MHDYFDCCKNTYKFVMTHRTNILILVLVMFLEIAFQDLVISYCCLVVIGKRGSSSSFSFMELPLPSALLEGFSPLARLVISDNTKPFFRLIDVYVAAHPIVM